MVSNLNFIFDNSNSLSTLSFLPGQILASGGGHLWLVRAFVRMGWICWCSPSTPVFLFPLCSRIWSGLQLIVCILVKRTKPSWNALLIWLTLSCTCCTSFFPPFILYVNRVIIKHIFWISNHSLDNYWYPKKHSFSLHYPGNI